MSNATQDLRYFRPERCSNLSAQQLGTQCKQNVTPAQPYCSCSVTQQAVLQTMRNIALWCADGIAEKRV